MITSTHDAAQRLREDPLSILEDLLTAINATNVEWWSKDDRHLHSLSSLFFSLMCLREATLGQDLILPKMVYTDEDLTSAVKEASDNARADFDKILAAINRLYKLAKKRASISSD